ncbi:hypothetical protein [Winogradskyella haliclonae]|uniref:Uncharacterized protein n=1 Tax=Winogradskyella haliclonae TaxID=2048558 RepID=A0ABQ2BW27_9FLAO|nr:hypothetical protein [Winogradskyella haliclonae]GGI56056.1 hypothetical protein GCM10011444_03650 [Winogradskyella haliclonae]
MFNYKLVKTLLTQLISLNFLLLYGQNDKPERNAFLLRVEIDSVNYYQQEVIKSPYFVKEKILQIYPSEKLYIETEIKSDSIFSMKTVNENLNPEKTIIIKFNQNTKGRLHDGMMLSVKNPFNKTLKYEALMYLNGGTEWIPTSIIPIRPNLENYELWNDIILSIVLVEWRIE